MIDENELIPKILSGELRVFKVLVTQYQNLVFSILNRLVPSADVEDVCQEVFIKVYKNLKYFQFQSKLSTWIAKIAYTTALNHNKKLKATFIYSENFEQFDISHFADENPEAILIKKEFGNYMNSLIQQLPFQLKTVLTLYHLNEFSYKEIEAITGYPEGSVKGYLFRARKLLKDKILEHPKLESYD